MRQADIGLQRVSAVIELVQDKAIWRMKNSTATHAVGVGMILGSMPLTLAGVLIVYVLASLDESRAGGRDLGFDAIGVLMMTFVAYLVALGSCVAGLLYVGLGVRSGRVILKTWHWIGIVYSSGQIMAATIYVVAGSVLS